MGQQCLEFNLGTCAGEVSGSECRTYQSCCPPQWGTHSFEEDGETKCGCQCVPPTSDWAGYTSGTGCATEVGAPTWLFVGLPSWGPWPSQLAKQLQGAASC